MGFTTFFGYKLNPAILCLQYNQYNQYKDDVKPWENHRQTMGKALAKMEVYPLVNVYITN